LCKIGEALYGRLKNYDAAFREQPDADSLETILARTVYEGVEHPPVEAMAAYVRRQKAHLEALSLRSLLDGELSWAAP
jgi:cytochrome b pre-mRNA-processing protein 3